MSGSQASGSDGEKIDLARLIRLARQALPSSHRALLEQIGVQDAVIDDWPAGVQALYETVR